MITVLGGNGFVGSNYCNLLSNATDPSARFIKNDKLNYLCQTEDVINFISTVDNYNVLTDSQVDIKTNLLVLVDTLDSWRMSGGTGCYTLISSWFVYGQDSGFGEGSRGISETDLCDPKGFYSITKRAAEQLLMSYCQTFGLNYKILRLSNVLGVGDAKVSAKKNALQYLLGEIKANRPINLYDSGEFYRDYIDVRDCVSAIDLVMRKGEPNSIYNIGNGVPLVFRELLQYAKERLNSSSLIQTIEQKEFHKKVQSSRSFFMNTQKIQSLGYVPKFTINQTLDDLLR